MYYENKNKTLASCIFKIIIIMLGGIGESLFFAEGDFKRLSQFTYYVHQINILSLVIMLFMLCLNIRNLKRIVNKEVVPAQKKYCSIVQYFMATTVAMPILVSAFAAFTEEIPLQTVTLHISNVITHFLFPILIQVDWIVFGRIYIKRVKGLYLYATIVPIIYTIYIIIAGRIFELPSFEGTLSFFDYEKNGWFRIAEGKIGVFYYIIIILAIMLLVNYIILKINLFCHKKENRKRFI